MRVCAVKDKCVHLARSQNWNLRNAKIKVMSEYRMRIREHFIRCVFEMFPRECIPRLPPSPLHLPLFDASWLAGGLAVAWFLTRYKLGPCFKSSNVDNNKLINDSLGVIV